MSQHQHDQALINLVTIKDTRFATTLEAGVTRVSISGNLLTFNRDQFKQLILDRIDAGDRRFIVDLTRCAAIDSSGWAVLVSINSKLTKAGGSLVLENPNEALRDFVEDAKLDQLFTIRRTNGRRLVPENPLRPGGR